MLLAIPRTLQRPLPETLNPKPYTGSPPASPVLEYLYSSAGVGEDPSVHAAAHHNSFLAFCIGGAGPS